MRIKQRRTFERSDRGPIFAAYCRDSGEVLECPDVVTLMQTIAKQLTWRSEHGLKPETWTIGAKGVVAG